LIESKEDECSVPAASSTTPSQPVSKSLASDTNVAPKPPPVNSTPVRGRRGGSGSRPTKSASSSSTSSRSRKNKKSFSVSQTSYEAGSLKLKIAALNIPNRRPTTAANNTTQSDKCNEPPPPAIQLSAHSNSNNNSPSPAKKRLGGMDKSQCSTTTTTTNSLLPFSNGETYSDKSRNNLSELSKTPSKRTDDDGSPRGNFEGDGLTITSFRRGNNSPRVSEGSSNNNNNKSSSTRSVSLTPGAGSKQNNIDYARNRMCSPPTSSPSSSTLPPVIPSLNSNDVTVTLNNGTLPLLSSALTNNHNPPTVVKEKFQFPSAVGSYSPSMYNSTSASTDQQLMDPVLRLHKNSDLTIFPINPGQPFPPSTPTSSSSSNNNKSHHSSGWNNHHHTQHHNNNSDVVMILPTPPSSTGSSTSSSVPSVLTTPSPAVRSSRRLSSHRRSLDKSDDFESWDSSDAHDAVAAAIRSIDSVFEKETLLPAAYPQNKSKGGHQHQYLSQPVQDKHKGNNNFSDKVAEIIKSSTSSLGSSPALRDITIQPIRHHTNQEPSSAFSQPNNNVNSTPTASSIAPITSRGSKDKRSSSSKSPPKKLTSSVVSPNSWNDRNVKTPSKSPNPLASSDLPPTPGIKSRSLKGQNNLINASSPVQKSSNSPENKKKSKLTCLMTSLSPKARAKPVANGEHPKQTDRISLLEINHEVPPPSNMKRTSEPSPSKITSVSSSSSTPNGNHYAHTKGGKRSSVTPTSSTTSSHKINNTRPHENSVELLGAASERVHQQQSGHHVPSSSLPISSSEGKQPPVRTKAAKKYIPESLTTTTSSSDLVNSSSSTPRTNNSKPSSKKVSNNKRLQGKANKSVSKSKSTTSSSGGRKKVKKSLSKEKSKKLRLEQIQKSLSNLPELREICTLVDKFTLKEELKVTRGRGRPPGHQKKKELLNNFIFRTKKYKNFNIPIFKSEPPITPPSKLQRLPLKKRHHDSNSRSPPNGIGLHGKCALTHVFDGSPHFEGIKILSKSVNNKVNDKFQRLGEGKDDKVLSFVSPTIISKTPGKSKASSTTTSATTTVTTKPTQVLSPDIVALEHRRSGRVRKPKKLDLDPEETENRRSRLTEKSSPPPPEPSIIGKKGKRENRRKAEEEIPPIPPAQELVVVDRIEVVEEEASQGKGLYTRPIKRERSPDIEELTCNVRPSKRSRLGKRKGFSLKAEVQKMERIDVPRPSPIPIDVKPPMKVELGGPSPDIALIDIKSERDDETIEELVQLGVNEEIPLMSPPPETSSINKTKKRRKVNRTGFPVKKKKKKPLYTMGMSSPSGTSLDVEIPSSSTEAEEGGGQGGGSGWMKKPQQLPLRIPMGPSTSSSSASASSQGDHQQKRAGGGNSSSSRKKFLNPTKFTPGITERVKTRRRLSTDDKLLEENLLQGSGIPTAFLDMVNPPIIMPEKTNYLAAGLYSNQYKILDEDDKVGGRNHLKPDSILPPPVDKEAEDHVRNKQFDFELPYDLWCMRAIKATHQIQELKAKLNNEKEQRALELAAEAKKSELRRRKSEAEPEAVGSVKLKRPKLPDIKPASWSFRKIKQSKFLKVYYSYRPNANDDDEEMRKTNCDTNLCVVRYLLRRDETTANSRTSIRAAMRVSGRAWKMC
jgi:hypothetical protein